MKYLLLILMLATSLFAADIQSVGEPGDLLVQYGLTRVIIGTDTTYVYGDRIKTSRIDLTTLNIGAQTVQALMRSIIADSGKFTILPNGHLKPRLNRSIEVDSLFTLISVVRVDTSYFRMAVLGEGGASVPLSVYGNKSTGYVTQFVNDKNKVYGDSSAAVDSKGQLIATGLAVGTLNPMATAHISVGSISSFPTTNLPWVKGLRLGNPDLATVGVQAFSPALIFKGSGWGTTAGAADSVLWAMVLTPVQGLIPSTSLNFYGKVGSAAWVSHLSINTGGTLTVRNDITTPYIRLSNQAVASANQIFLNADSDNSGSDGVISFGRGALLTPAQMEYARFTHAGYFTVGAGANAAAMIHGNNSNVLSKPLFRLGSDKVGVATQAIDSLAMSVTGMRKFSFSDVPSDTTSQWTFVSRNSGQGSGIGLTSRQWNKWSGTTSGGTPTWAANSDTSSMNWYIDSAGGPRFSMKTVDGDTVSFNDDGSLFRINAKNPVYIYRGSSYVGWDGSSFSAGDSDARSLGSITKLWQNYWGTDNIYLGGKSQTATMTIGTQAVMTEQSDSCMVHTMVAGQPKSKYFSASGLQLNFLGQRAATYDADAWDCWFSTGGAGADTLWVSIDGTNAAPLVFGTRVAKH